MNHLSIEQLKELTKPVKPFLWKKYDLTVVGDGYTEEGKRIHLVRESLSQERVELANAIVIGDC
ncbi:hypothetical protein AB4455_12230 [Vibrio sp. 10N.261.46.E12]|uniref:hypothetical protein n=1 Tax=unclassified Vibrio TaxID=2614977 RepID=UPI0009753CC7|nr:MULTISPECIES: hypothetical protein [unclassified Vibrio]OMO34205.1 hypothetical protein BH584_13380 [Vibrio sp. 10N.261.45.E1]PMJ33145.1 hypothetical protein BCU27_25215 [Vibrio sp. 10N.286.45.B6]PML86364.1 hypothetical protein BCT66_14330 [Vibrio sp. 10N.261.49.E11]PMM77480.1 hypothetical protein BCT48_23770 [Vibrio sp. 10N.261.46.F12]PMM90618.1 hypothetical protein BCT46_03345 [Vibrio sp. 10N.261.46.E8]